MLQGRCLVANIDHVPCTIQLPDSVIGAHQSGALPLNTLANAILAKNDQMRQMAAMQYEEQARGERGATEGEYSEARQQNCRERWLGKPIIECD